MKRVAMTLSVILVLALLVVLVVPAFGQGPTGIGANDTGLFKRLIAYQVDGQNPLYVHTETANGAIYSMDAPNTSMVARGVAGVNANTENAVVYIQGTTPADTAGNNTHDGIRVDMAIGNATAGTNLVRGIQVDDIVGDAQVTETAINIGSGWDVGFTSASPVSFSGTFSAATLDVGGGYGSTGCSISAAGVLQCNGAATTDGAVTADSAVIGGGFGSTGCTATTAGALACDGNVTTAGSVTTGGGYPATGTTITAAGVFQTKGAITTDSSLTGDSVVVGGGFGATGCTGSTAGAMSCNDQVLAGGGYGDTGCTMSAAGVLQCNGAGTLDGALTADSATLGGGYGSTGVTVTNAGNVQANGGGTFDAGLSIGVATAADIVLQTDPTGGNGGARSQIIGVGRMKLAGMLGGTNGTAAGKTAVLTDDTPAGEYVDIDAHTTTTNDGTYFRVGVNSLKTAYGASAVATDGTTYDTSGAALDWTDDENVGGWMMCSKALAAGDIVYSITDDPAGETLVNVPAVTTANVWQWVEVDITAVANASKDHIHAVGFELSAAGAAKVTFNCYFDRWYKWDQTEEDTLNATPLQDGVTGVINTVAGNVLAEDTDYFVDYTDGALVYITDQSAAIIMASVYY